MKKNLLIGLVILLVAIPTAYYFISKQLWINKCKTNIAQPCMAECDKTFNCFTQESQCIDGCSKNSKVIEEANSCITECWQKNAETCPSASEYEPEKCAMSCGAREIACELKKNVADLSEADVIGWSKR